MSKIQTVGASVTSEMKERIKTVAKSKYWSVGQTLGLFIERYWEEWEKELGIESKSAKTAKSRKSRANKPESP